MAYAFLWSQPMVSVLPPPTPEVSTTHWAGLLGVFREHLSCCATPGPYTLSPSYIPGRALFQPHLFLLSILFAFFSSLSLVNLDCLCLMPASVTSPPPNSHPRLLTALVSMAHSGVVYCSSCLGRPASFCLPDSWQRVSPQRGRCY